MRHTLRVNFAELWERRRGVYRARTQSGSEGTSITTPLPLDESELPLHAGHIGTRSGSLLRFTIGTDRRSGHDRVS